jgi:riboflavin kinase / FMN adenylyltransferase
VDVLPDRPPRFRVFRGPVGVAAAIGPNVVAFGKFDGVHRGHRALLDRAAAAARRLGISCGAVSFERHPEVYLRRNPAPPTLVGLGEKLRPLRSAGADFVVLLPADASVLGVPAAEFARDVLRGAMDVRLVVVGSNFRFGRGGTGGVGTFRELTSVEGIDGVEVATVQLAGGPVSSTRIRHSLAQGDVELAAALLGRTYNVRGRLAQTAPSPASPAVVVARSGSAVPAPGRYLGSIHLPARPPLASAVIDVQPSDKRPVLSVQFGDGSPRSGPVVIAFDRRL